MSISVKLHRALCLALSLLLVSSVALASEEQNAVDSQLAFYTYADVQNPNTRINVSQILGKDTLVIPANATADEVALFCDSTATFTISGEYGKTDFVSGQIVDLASLCPKGEYELEITDGTKEYKLKFLFTDNIPSLYLLSDDPVTKGRTWVDSGTDKSNKATGNMVMLTSEGETVHSGALTQIKGRGNTTWGLVKKPYQIKLDQKVDLLSTGDDINKSKTWVLLANYLDPVGIRNTLALSMGSALGMPMNIQGESVNLYYDGEYRGMYMLTEKVEVGSGRVGVDSLEEANQKANPGTKFEEFPVVEGNTKNGAIYTYCEGMISPADISGGYLLEMDYKVRALEEICYICTSRDNYVVVKSPEYASKEEMDYIATMYQEYEDAVFGGGVNPNTGKKYSDYIDVTSLACYYIVNEFSKSRDCFSSSAYLNKKAGEDKFVMGPLWDYDMSFGKGSYEDYYIDDDPLGFSVLNVKMGKALFDIDDFCGTLKEIYQNNFGFLIKDVVLGDKDAVSEKGNLRSLEYYQNLLNTSAKVNTALWYEGQSWEEEVSKLKDFITQRYTVLNEYFDTLTASYELPPNAYYDVLSGDWFYDVVSTASQRSILNGAGNGFFKPLSTVKRSQAVQAVFNMSGVKEVEYKPIYSDVRMNDWYSDAAVWAAVNGYLQGFSDGCFKPDNVVTREEFVKLLYDFIGAPNVEISLLEKFEDKSLIAYPTCMEWAVREGIIEGADNMINPLGSMTRAEMAAILVRYYDLCNK